MWWILLNDILPFFRALSARENLIFLKQKDTLAAKEAVSLMSFGKIREGALSQENIEKTPVIKTGGGNVDAFLGKGSKAVGALTFSGPAEIDGDIEGEIHSKDRLSIGEAANIKAKILGAEIVVRGTVSGDIVASRALILKRPAKITGNIQAPSLSIEEGVTFEGKCSMTAGQNHATLKPVEKAS